MTRLGIAAIVMLALLASGGARSQPPEESPGGPSPAGRPTPPSTSPLPGDIPSSPGERDLPSPPGRHVATPNLRPMIFYVAKGPMGSCGAGCDTWIAADGYFDDGSADRFRRLLQRLGSRKLPIYFFSGGGLLREARAIGHMLRNHKITAGVGLSVPQGCTQAKPEAEDCLKVKASGRDLPAKLIEWGSYCASACVDAIAGAATRLVAPGARLAVHRPALSLQQSGRAVRTVPPFIMRRSLEMMKSYFAEMGIKPELVDLIATIPNESIRTLTRAEVARFGIDARPFAETRWFATSTSGGKKLVFKEVAQIDRKGADYATRLIVLWCSSRDELTLRYQRDEDDVDEIGRVRIDIGGDPILYGRNIAHHSGRTEYRQGSIGIARLRHATARSSIRFSEGKTAAQRVFDVSTDGLAAAIDTLSCGMTARHG